MRASRGIASTACRSSATRALGAKPTLKASSSFGISSARRGKWDKPEEARLLPPISYKGRTVMPVIGYRTKGSLSVYVDIVVGNRLIDENLNVLTDENGDTLVW